MIALTDSHNRAGSAFDTIAESYDSLFTTSVIGRSQRAAVWKEAASVFRVGDRVLELNCGTGEDALFLAGKGISVTACDASARMIEQARARKADEAPWTPIEFHILCTEHLDNLPSGLHFDGVFSNFSGLNCVEDLSETARMLADRLDAGAHLLLCLSTRLCMWEILHYLFRAEFQKAFRRWRGVTEAKVGLHSLRVYYPTLHSFQESFMPMFCLRSITGIGIAVPPSYMEEWARRNPCLFRICEIVDDILRRLPGVRVLGDHMLLHLEKV
jgi:ubiquinone/menaquinone biosynthesis C-methylase UbiE